MRFEASRPPSSPTHFIFVFVFCCRAKKTNKIFCNNLRNFHRSVNFVWCEIIAIKTNLKEKNRLLFFFCNFFLFLVMPHVFYTLRWVFTTFWIFFFLLFFFFIFFKMSLCNIGLFIAYNIIVWLYIKDIFTIFLEIKIKEFKYKHINRIWQKSNTTNNQPKFIHT